MGCAGWSRVKRGKWDNCNSTVNKEIYIKKFFVFNFGISVMIRLAVGHFGFILFGILCVSWSCVSIFFPPSYGIFQ